MKNNDLANHEGQLSHYITSTNRSGQSINIPVIDVRDGIAERILAKSFIKAANRSRFLSYNEYHVSKKQAI